MPIQYFSSISFKKCIVVIKAGKIMIISHAIVIDNGLVITEDLFIILPVCLSMTLTIWYTLLYIFGQTSVSKQCRPR